MADEHGGAHALDGALHAHARLLDAPPSDETGERVTGSLAHVDDRYTVLRVVARGGNAWVLQAEHNTTERLVALKVAFPDAASRERIRAEAKVLGALARSPGVVSVLDARIEDDAYLALEWLRGRSLEGILTARGALGESATLSLAELVAGTLAEVHEAGHVHGDLAPKHVFITHDLGGREAVKLIDFASVATVMEADRAPEPWTAPEVLGARSRTAASDVFALGDLLARCLVGRPAGRAELPKTGLGELVAFALSPKPGERPPASVMRREIARLRGAQPSAEAPGRDLRKKPRANYVAPVRVTRGGATLDGRSEDVSEGGMMLVLRQPCTANETLGLRFALPIDGRVVSCTVRVAWSRSHMSELHAVGVELVDPPAEIVAALAQYIKLMGGDAHR